MSGKPRVLVVRPEPGATETAQRLDRLGFEAVKLPLQETRTLPAATGALRDAVAVTVTSANALRHAPPELLRRLSRLPCFAVGEATAAAARTAGFVEVVDGKGDAGGLARVILAARPAGTVVYLCGRVRRQDFELALAAQGVTAHAVETYDTVVLNHGSTEVLNAMSNAPADFALVHSANAAESLAGLMGRPELSGLLGKTTIVCISPRVADAFEGHPAGEILVAGEPNEEALLALLGQAAGLAS